MTVTGGVGLPTRPQARLLTLKWHNSGLVDTCISEQVAVVIFVTIGQAPQSDTMLYCRVEQLEMAGVHLNTSLQGRG